MSYRVAIVCHKTREDQILYRLACTLADYTGWSVSEALQPAADINYLLPYCEADYFAANQWPATLVAAWFTHRDDPRKEKVNTWYRVARRVDLRTTSAGIYYPELAQHGRTHMVTPPLDRDKFSPGQNRPRREVPVVGISGYVYSGGRKGEGLALQIMQSLRRRVEWSASGKGWPCTCREYPWERMQDFYRNLDLYFCPSSIEGVGYPVLEALACGVPCVVPQGVGVFDDLGHPPGIYRYAPSDARSALTALELALGEATQIDREVLRETTRKYTPEAWAENHKSALGALLGEANTRKGDTGYMPDIVSDSPKGLTLADDWRSQCGVYYVAYGDPARNCARKAIRSFKKHMPGIQVALVGSAPLNAGEDVFIQNCDEDLGARSVKTKIYDLAPATWRYVLYLDSDTEITADISFLFKALVSGWDLIFCINPAQYVLGKEMKRPDNGDECKATFEQIGTDEFIQLNGGVFGFARNERTACVIRGWHSEWGKWKKRDQAALDRSLYSAPLRIYVLGCEWNTVTRYLSADRTAGILHYPMTARRWKGVVRGPLDGKEAWASLHPQLENK